MHGSALPGEGKLGARNQLDPQPGGFRLGCLDPRLGVVIGESKSSKTGRRGSLDERGGFVRPIGCVGVAVKVDQSELLIQSAKVTDSIYTVSVGRLLSFEPIPAARGMLMISSMVSCPPVTVPRTEKVLVSTLASGPITMKN